MAFQLLTGVLPYRADSMAELMFKIANEPPPDVRAVRSDLPAVLADVVVKAMAKDLTVRYARGNDMARDLRSSLGGMLTAPQTVSATMDFENTQPGPPEGFATTVVLPASPERPA
jgi:serine/threonine-protein kinase